MKRRMLNLGKARQAIEADPNWELVTIGGREVVQKTTAAKGRTEIHWEVVQSGGGECNIQVAARIDDCDDVVFTYGIHDGEMRCTEIHVRAPLDAEAEGGRRLPIWSGTFKRLGLSAVSKQIYREMDEPWIKYLLSGLEDDAWVDAFSHTQRPGRKGYSDYWYARLASEYVEAVKRNPRAPAKEMRETSTLDGLGGRKTIQNRILDARKRGLLTAAPVRGRAGGELTPKAIALLKGDDQ